MTTTQKAGTAAQARIVKSNKRKPTARKAVVRTEAAGDVRIDWHTGGGATFFLYGELADRMEEAAELLGISLDDYVAQLVREAIESRAA
jgi:hypothetical protein